MLQISFLPPHTKIANATAPILICTNCFYSSCIKLSNASSHLRCRMIWFRIKPFYVYIWPFFLHKIDPQAISDTFWRFDQWLKLCSLERIQQLLKLQISNATRMRFRNSCSLEKSTQCLVTCQFAMFNFFLCIGSIETGISKRCTFLIYME